MKKIIVLILCITMISQFGTFSVLAADYTKEEQTAAENLFQYLNPSDKRTAEIYRAYKSKDYKAALALYRNYFVDKLRRINVGQLGWHDSNIAATYVGLADIMCGKMTIEQFKQKFDDRGHHDFMEMNGDPSEKKPINWLGGMEEDNNHGQSAGLGFEVNFRNMNRLAGAYWTNDSDEIYIQKYMQILDDYCLNEKRVTDEYLAEHPDACEGDIRFWVSSGKYAQSYLWMFERIKNTIRCFGIFSKLLPCIENTEKVPWSDVCMPVTTTLKPESYDIIDPIITAHYAYSMITDHTELAKNVLKDGFLIANQHNDGVMAFSMMMNLFDEFSVFEQYSENVEHALHALISELILPDGSVTERSFNYNDATVGSFKALVEFFDYDGAEKPGYADKFMDSVNNWYKLQYGYRTSAGYIPNIGNGGSAETALPIWRDDKALKTREENVTVDSSADYKSIYFPYGGYGVMRSGWDIKNDMSLNFYNNNKESEGHVSQFVNAIWLSAYGRPLIASGGCPWYGEGFAPEEQLEIYDVLNEYFDEGSTFKGSTVAVNGKDQSMSKISAKEILKTPWMAGENFDYAEGLWDGGYDDSQSAEHTRSFIFVRKAGIYIVADDLKNNTSATNTYSQIWRLPCYIEGEKEWSGFAENQVDTDESEKVLKTVDESGPNIWISNFSSDALKYEKYYGVLSPKAIGWSHGGTGGIRYPAVDVHINWTDEGNKQETNVVSVLDPTEGTHTPYISKTDLSDKDKGITGFEYVTDENVRIKYLSSVSQQELTIDDITVNGSLLLVATDGGDTKNVLVRGADKTVVGDRKLELQNDSFEFTVSGDEINILNYISVPTNFQWVMTSDEKYYPKYNSLSEDMAQSLIDSTNNYSLLLRTLKYSDSLYIINYTKYIINKTDLSMLPDFPTEEMLDEQITSVNSFIEKNYDIARIYRKTEFSEKLSDTMRILFDKCLEYAENNRNIEKNLSAYVKIMKCIEGNSEDVSPDSEATEYFKNTLVELETEHLKG